MYVPPNDALSLRHRVFLDTMREHGFGIEARPLVARQSPAALSWPAVHAPARQDGHRHAAIKPDDVSGIFRALREKQLKFVRMGTCVASSAGVASTAGVASSAVAAPAVAAPAVAAPAVAAPESEVDDAPAEYLRRHTFASALVDGVQPYSCFIGTPGERARVVTRFVGGAVVGMTADVAGLVKRFRKATGVQHHAISEEAMRIALYDTDTLYDDNNLSDIVIFHTAATLKMAIVIAAPENAAAATRIFPPDASLRDRALLLVQARNGSFSLEPASSPGTTLLDALKRINGYNCDNAAPLSSMKADELRAFASKRFGLGARQVAELHAIMRKEVSPTTSPVRVTKAVLREALDLLMAAE